MGANNDQPNATDSQQGLQRTGVLLVLVDIKYRVITA